MAPGCMHQRETIHIDYDNDAVGGEGPEIAAQPYAKAGQELMVTRHGSSTATVRINDKDGRTLTTVETSDLGRGWLVLTVETCG